jgi:hypothetical protein
MKPCLLFSGRISRLSRPIFIGGKESEILVVHENRKMSAPQLYSIGLSIEMNKQRGFVYGVVSNLSTVYLVLMKLCTRSSCTHSLKSG